MAFKLLIKIIEHNVLRLCVRAACRMFQVCTNCMPPDAKPLLSAAFLSVNQKLLKTKQYGI